MAASDQEDAEGPFYGPHHRSRQLTSEDQVWDFNCWDDVAWDAEEEARAEEIVAQQRLDSALYQRRRGNLDGAQALLAAAEDHKAGKKWMRSGPREEDLQLAAAKWDSFYTQHERWFFKDRHWLTGEFRELFFDTTVSVDTDAGQASAVDFSAARRIVELGCGAGNTVFPIWRERRDDPTLEHLYACDFSSKAVELVRSFREFVPAKMTAFVHDLSTDDGFDASVIAPGSIDAAVAIFVLSALRPERLAVAFRKIFDILRPGGLLLFRDYGRYDLTQLRLKADRLIDDDFYFRGDGTTVYFFTPERLRELAQAAGFVVLEARHDRRLITNRFRRLKMHRNWVQAKFMRPLQTDEAQ